MLDAKRKTDAHDLYLKAVRLLQENDLRSNDEIVAAYERASEKGSDLADFDLGALQEQERRYDAAASYYGRALKTGYRKSIYRLALLHGGGKLTFSDRDFYLKVMQRLAQEGHVPSAAKHSKERIRGSYGWRQIVPGILSFPVVFSTIFYHGWHDPDAEGWRFDR